MSERPVRGDLWGVCSDCGDEFSTHNRRGLKAKNCTAQAQF